MKAMVEEVWLNEPATQSAQAESGHLFSHAAEGAFEPAGEWGGGGGRLGIARRGLGARVTQSLSSGEQVSAGRMSMTEIR